MDVATLAMRLLQNVSGMAIDIVAISLAVIRWKLHPLASALVVSASTLGLLHTGLLLVLPAFDAQVFTSVLSGLMLFGRVGQVLMVAAVFVERTPRAGSN